MCFTNTKKAQAKGIKGTVELKKTQIAKTVIVRA